MNSFMERLKPECNENRVQQKIVDQVLLNGIKIQNNVHTLVNSLETTHSWQISIPENTIINDPFIISSFIDDLQPTIIENLIIKVGSGTRITFHDNTSNNIYIKKISLELEPHAQVTFFGDYQTLSGQSKYVQIHSLIKESALFECNIIIAASGTSELSVEALLAGRSAYATITVASLSNDQGFCLVETKQNHKAAHTNSTVKVKQLAADSSQMQYKSLIDILPIARQVTAHQKHTALLLNRTARIDANPQLNVEQNKEVHCSHGSAISQLDDLLIWYCTSRGVSITDAKSLLIEGFFSDLCNYNDFSKALKKQLTKYTKE